MAEHKVPHSLKEQSADQIRNEQRGGIDSPVDPNRDGGIEGNATMRKVWSEPGGEAYNYRQGQTGQTSQAGMDDPVLAAKPATCLKLWMGTMPGTIGHQMPPLRHRSTKRR